MLRETMRTEVRRRLGELFPDFWSDAEIDEQLDEAVRRFTHEERWPWLQSVFGNIPVAQGNPLVELIDDVDRTRHFSLMLRPSGSTDDRDLIVPKPVSPTKGLELRQRFSGPGKPRWFYVQHVTKNIYGAAEGSSPALVVRLVPTPEKAYTAEYLFYRNPEAWADASEPLIPDQYQGAVIAWATGQCWLKELNGGGKAQEQFNLYNTVLDQARGDLYELAHDESVTWGGGEPREMPRTTHEWVEERIQLPLG